ncbi:LamG-like jellyroll fold domain-containing protein [Paenibacillus mendelii]|uniref:LamG-like jellyroll fold domain-containing protein n=1 Tax=Paenibacillus mendelii TaxID=206163 RepID=A0ABV6J9S9_9BACL|nr:LamG-like jellyroll fold domain-containing protein [Paenibacillus mendelii]MCQ6559573.1 pentapeptide repeat-containing protein [Paenibacillus mendelii]
MADSLRNGLIAEYLFQDGCRDTGNTGIYEGQVHGAVPAADRFGNPDGAYEFNGINDYIVVQPAPKLNREAFSLSVWARYGRDASLSGWNNAIVSQDGHHERRVFQLSTHQQQVTWHRFFQADEVFVQEPVNPGLWNHYAAVYDGSKHKLYRNGILMSEKTGGFEPSDDEPLYIGRKATDEPYFFFRGAIDDIRIYDRPITDDEIVALYTENGWSNPKLVAASQQAKTGSEQVELKHKRDPNQKLWVENSNIAYSVFVNCRAESMKFHEVSLPGLSMECVDLHRTRIHNVDFSESKISDANLSDLEIDGAQLGGAYIHNIGLPPKGHPAYVEGSQQRPLLFENCDLHGSEIRDCNLRGVSIQSCSLQGMTIDGISVEALLEAYRNSKEA